MPLDSNENTSKSLKCHVARITSPAFKMDIPDATCSGAKKWGKAHVLNKLSEITKNVTIGGNTT